MPGVVIQIADLERSGPLIMLHLALPVAAEAALVTAGQQLPNPVPAHAMGDTGAEISVLQQGLASRLGLPPSGMQYVTTPTAARLAYSTYRARFVFPGGGAIETTVVETPLPARRVQCLLGRDVLAQAVFTYVGPSGLFSFSF